MTSIANKEILLAEHTLGLSTRETVTAVALMSRGGVEVAARAFPNKREEILAVASDLHSRRVIEISDLGGQTVDLQGCKVQVSSPCNFESFNLVFRDFSPTRTKVTIRFVSEDTALVVGSSLDEHAAMKPRNVISNPVLRLAVANSLTALGGVYLKRALQNREGISGHFLRHLDRICKTVMDPNNILPGIHLTMTPVPTKKGTPRKFTLTAQLSLSFELHMYGPSDHIKNFVNVIKDPAYFELTGVAKVLEGVKDEPEAADLLRQIQALAPAARHHRSRRLKEEPQQNPPITEVIHMVGDDAEEDPIAVEVVELDEDVVLAVKNHTEPYRDVDDGSHSIATAGTMVSDVIPDISTSAARYAAASLMLQLVDAPLDYIMAGIEKQAKVS